MNWRQLLWTYTLIAAVSAISLFVFGTQFSDARLSIAVVAVATIAFVSVILGALLSGIGYLGDEPTGGAAVEQR